MRVESERVEANFLNPFSYMKEGVSTQTLTTLTAFYLDKWAPLIVEKRGRKHLSELIGLVLDYVTSHFNGAYESLEAYVKSIALTMPLPSLVSDTELDDKTSVQSFVGLGIDEVVLDVGVPYWSLWLDELRNKDLSSVGFSSDLLFTLFRLTPFLEQALHLEVEEMVALDNGVSKQLPYRTWYKALVKSCREVLRVLASEVEESLSLWLALYLQNREVLQTQVALWLMSSINPYTNLKRERLVKFTSETNEGWGIKSSLRTVNLFTYDVSELIDRLFSVYFSDKEVTSPFVFEFNGEKVYNVLGGSFVTEGDLGRYLEETVLELILQETKMRFVAKDGSRFIFECRESAPVVMVYHYYYGELFVFNLENKGKFVERLEDKGVGA